MRIITNGYHFWDGGVLRWSRYAKWYFDYRLDRWRLDGFVYEFPEFHHDPSGPPGRPSGPASTPGADFDPPTGPPGPPSGPLGSVEWPPPPPPGPPEFTGMHTYDMEAVQENPWQPLLDEEARRVSAMSKDEKDENMSDDQTIVMPGDAATLTATSSSVKYVDY